MAKSAAERTTKYGNKVSANVVSARITAEGPTMIANFTLQTAALVQMQAAARAYLSNTPPVTSPTQIPSYLAFAGQCYRIIGTYTGSLAQAEALRFKDVWKSRGLDNATLIALAKLQGLTVA